MFEEGNSLKARYGADKVFDFSIGNPDVPPPPAFYKVLAGIAAEKTTGVHGYMPNAGFDFARAALAKKISLEQGVECPAACVVMSVGAAGALNVVLKALLDAGSEVIVSAPFFPEYRAYCANHGGILIPVPACPDFELDVEAIAKTLNANTRALIINSPNNPTGRIYSAASLDALGRLLNEHERKTGQLPFIIADEPYRDIVYGGLETPKIFPRFRNSVVVSSFSKTLSLPGERIGYIAVNPGSDEFTLLLDALIYATRVLGFVNAPALMQRAVAQLTMERVCVDIYEKRRDAFIEVLDAAGLEYVKPQGAFYIFAKVPEHDNKSGGAAQDDIAFADFLKRRLILGVPGSGFGKSGWIRFAYCVNEEIIRSSKNAFVDSVKEWKNGAS
jgi:aspartate aminotransferase